MAIIGRPAMGKQMRPMFGMAPNKAKAAPTPRGALPAPQAKVKVPRRTGGAARPARRIKL